MKLSIKPVHIPFMVGDTVWVDQPIGPNKESSYFQGTIMQIILDGSLSNTLVIRQRKKVHELVIGTAVYGMKPVGIHAGAPRESVTVPLQPLVVMFFETEEALQAHQNKPY